MNDDPISDGPNGWSLVAMCSLWAVLVAGIAAMAVGAVVTVVR